MAMMMIMRKLGSVVSILDPDSTCIQLSLTVPSSDLEGWG